MFKELKRIIQEAETAKDLAEALNTIVAEVRETIAADTCSIYLINEEHGEYVLTAAAGIKKNLLGKVKFKFGEGLIGLVAEREEPINLENAQQHAKFCNNTKTKERKFHAYLGAPVIYQRDLLGVLIAQRKTKQRFSESEASFLVTLAAQLAEVINLARSEVPALGLGHALVEKVINGKPTVPGIGIGKAVVVYPPADLSVVPDKKITNIDEQITAFKNALLAAKKEIAALRENLASLPKDEQGLFDAYLQILNSASLQQEVINQIQEGNWAQAALRRVIRKRIAQFEAMDDAYLKERAADFQDLGRRILAQLQASDRIKPIYAENTILVGEEVTPAAIADVPGGYLVGVVSVTGSSNSHAAILCRAMGIPTVMGVSDLPVNQLDGQELVIDGYYGQIYLAPSVEIKRQFTRLYEEERELDAELIGLKELPAKTTDDHEVKLMVNAGLAVDMMHIFDVGALGVGLFRTEMPFMVRDRFPSEDEQCEIYRQLLNSFKPHPVTMRTLDIGGDKVLPYFSIKEDNPFLGWRGIRVTLDHPEIFLVQVRAMLKASVGLDNLQIMLPMVTSVNELEESIRLIKQAHAELEEDGLNIKFPKIGVMIEVPSAVYQAHKLAQYADFLSVGSNDLTQYLLAVDRNNTRVANLYDSLHPAVLRALVQIVGAAKKENKPVSICGEMASDPVAVIILIAMGFNILSMNANNLLRTKWIVRQFSFKHAKELLYDVLQMDDAIEIRCHLELALEDAGLAGLIRAGK